MSTQTIYKRVPEVDFGIRCDKASDICDVDEEDEDDLEDELSGRPRVALPIEDDDHRGSNQRLDESQAPSTGNEYLRRVHREAQRCPQVVVAAIDPARLRPADHKRITAAANTPSAQKLPPLAGFEPSMEWQLEQVSCFSEVRQKFALEKHRWLCERETGNFQHVEQAQQHLVTNLLNSAAGVEAWEEAVDKESITPLVSLLASLSGRQVLRLIGWLTQLIARSFSAERGRWVYALLVALEKPLSPDACDSIRTLARAASRTRAKLGNRTAEAAEDDHKAAHRALVTGLNLVICLVSRYFSQTDLVD